MTNETLEDQHLLRESLQSWLRKEYTPTRWRAIAEGNVELASRAWSQFAEMGWLALGIPETYGGLGGSASDQLLIANEFGGALVLEPYLSSVVIGAGLVELLGSQAQCEDLLPKVAQGTMKLAFAFAEHGARFAPERTALRAVQKHGTFHLSGRKIAVWDVPSAEQLIVLARTAGAPGDRDGLSLFLVARDAPGIQMASFPMVDRRPGAHIEFRDTPVLEQLGTSDGDAIGAVEAIIDRACIWLSGEACGAMRSVTAQSIEYLQQRHQFGKPLAEFQALRHRVVEMKVAIEMAHALSRHAAASITLDTRRRGLAAAASKVQAGRSGIFVGQQAVQLHGGMGMTDELQVGHYFKRLTMIDMAFGHADHHQSRFANLSRSVS